MPLQAYDPNMVSGHCRNFLSNGKDSFEKLKNVQKGLFGYFGADFGYVT